MVANIGLIVAILFAGFGVWRYYGEPGLPGGSDDPPTVPGVAMQPSTPEPTEAPEVVMPPVATPQPTTDCDFSQDIPLFQYVESSPTDGTALLLTPDGDLVLTCPEEQEDTTLATGVAGAGPREWPGIVGIYYEAEQPQVQPLAVLNLLTGEIVDIGVDPESVQYQDQTPAGSPWLVAPDYEDPGQWQVTDLRTMESRLVSDFTGGRIPEGAGILAAANGAGGSIVIAPYGGGMALVIEGSLDHGHWISLPADLSPVTETALAPDGQHLALKSNPPGREDPSGELLPGATHTYTIVNTTDGTEVAQSETFEDFETTMQWVQDGEALVYTQDTSLMLMSTGPGTETSALIEGNPRLRLQGPTVDPDIVLASREPMGEYATVVPTGEEVHLYAVNTRTGEMVTIQGRDVSHNLDPWLPPTRFLVMYEPQIAPGGPITYPVMDAVTGEQLGEIADVPLRDIGVPGIFYPDLGLRSVVGTMDGNTEIIAFDSQHIHLMTLVDGMPTVRQIASPPGLLSDVTITVSMFLSPDGSMLSLTGQGDESQTRWLLALDGEGDEWIEVPKTVASEDPGYILFIPGTGD